MQLQAFASYDLSASKLVNSFPCSLVNCDGNYAGGGGEYFQIFDKATAPVANDIPIKSYSLAGAGPLPSIFGELTPLNLTRGLGFGISSVNEKYTASASAYDVFGDIEATDLQPLINPAGTAGVNFTVVGDLTSNVQTITAWTSAIHRLVQIDIITPTGGPWYLMIFGGSIVDGLRSIIGGNNKLLASTTYKFNYGNMGREIYQKSATGILVTNCQICISDTADVLTTTLDNHKIRAIYRD